jgi:hypothetical protein
MDAWPIPAIECPARFISFIEFWLWSIVLIQGISIFGSPTEGLPVLVSLSVDGLFRRMLAKVAAVAVAHEEMHPKARSQACEGDERRQRDAGDEEHSDYDGEAPGQLESSRQSGDRRRV